MSASCSSRSRTFPCSAWTRSSRACAPPAASRAATRNRSRSFSLSSSSVNSLAFATICRMSWPLRVSSSVDMASTSAGILPQGGSVLLLHGLQLPVQEHVLQRDAGLLDDDLEGLEPRRLAPRLRVVSDEERDRRPVRHQGQD